MNALKITTSVLALIAAGLGFGMWKNNGAHQAEIESLKAKHAAALATKHEEMQSAMAAQADQHQQAIQTLNADYDKKLTELQQSQRSQLQNAYKEFENIFDGNKKTIDYINLLEDKVKAGQTISKAEVERLAVITTGISYLQKQYQKPLDQFSELASFFEKQSALRPERPQGNFFRRVFSKEYKEAERQFNREEGMKQAYEQAQSKFTGVYSSAQRQMAAVNIDADAQVKKLYSLIEDKQQANKEDLTGFFDQARKALKTHQDVLKFEPENLPTSLPLPRP